MSKIRVLRLLEYTYDSVEDYERDSAGWQHGVHRYGTRGPLVKSVVLPLEVLAGESVETGAEDTGFNGKPCEIAPTVGGNVIDRNKARCWHEGGLWHDLTPAPRREPRREWDR